MERKKRHGMHTLEFSSNLSSKRQRMHVFLLIYFTYTRKEKAFRMSSNQCVV